MNEKKTEVKGGQYFKIKFNRIKSEVVLMKES